MAFLHIIIYFSLKVKVKVIQNDKKGKGTLSDDN